MNERSQCWGIDVSQTGNTNGKRASCIHTNVPRERSPCPIEAELIIATLKILETPLLVLISKRELS